MYAPSRHTFHLSQGLGKKQEVFDFNNYLVKDEDKMKLSSTIPTSFSVSTYGSNELNDEDKNESENENKSLDENLIKNLSENEHEIENKNENEKEKPNENGYKISKENQKKNGFNQSHSIVWQTELEKKKSIELELCQTQDLNFVEKESKQIMKCRGKRSYEENSKNTNNTNVYMNDFNGMSSRQRINESVVDFMNDNSETYMTIDLEKQFNYIQKIQKKIHEDVNNINDENKNENKKNKNENENENKNKNANERRHNENNNSNVFSNTRTEIEESDQFMIRGNIGEHQLNDKRKRNEDLGSLDATFNSTLSEHVAFDSKKSNIGEPETKLERVKEKLKEKEGLRQKAMNVEENEVEIKETFLSPFIWQFDPIFVLQILNDKIQKKKLMMRNRNEKSEVDSIANSFIPKYYPKNALRIEKDFFEEIGTKIGSESESESVSGSGTEKGSGLGLGVVADAVDLEQNSTDAERKLSRVLKKNVCAQFLFVFTCNSYTIAFLLIYFYLLI